MSGGRGAANGAGEAAATMETASTSGAFTASVLSFMRWKVPLAASQTVPPVRRELYVEMADETGFATIPCFGARTFIPCRFTATLTFSAGFDDGGRPYVTTS